MPLRRFRITLLLSAAVVLNAFWGSLAPPFALSSQPAAGQPSGGFEDAGAFGVIEEGGFAAPAPVPTEADDVAQDKAAASKYAAEMAKLDNQTLLHLVAGDGQLATQIDDLILALDEALFSQLTAVEFVNIAIAEVEAVESPYTESFLEAAHSQQLLKQIKEDLANLKEGELPDPARLSIRTRWGTQTDAEDTDTTLADAAREERRRVKRQQAEANRLLDYFNRLSEEWKNYRDILEHRDSVTTGYADQLAQVIDLELKRIAAVHEIETRISDGKLAANEVPQEVLDSADPDVIQDFLAARREFRDSQKTERQQDARTRQRVEMSLLWKAWSEILSLNVDSRVPVANTAVTELSAATLKRDELEEFERRSLEIRSQEAHKAATTRSDTFLSMLLSPEDRERFESGLAFYFLEREDAKRRIDEYKNAAAAYQESIDISAQLRDAMAGSPDDLTTALTARFGEYTRARYMAAIAAHPEWKQQYVDQYAQLGQFDFPLLLDEQPGDVDYWANRLMVAQARWLGQQRWRDDIEFLLSRLGVVADVARLREHAAEIQLQLATTEARAKNVEQLIASLSADYRKRMNSNALNNLIQLLAIPVVALILTFAVRRFCARLEKKKEGQTPGDTERARRMGTLARTASGALSALIWFLAVIYMLRLTGLDITPIVASASVLGLAIAFASQALIKDFFTGFVILWENQYAVGDWVETAGVAGEVERISLRVTVLRDFDGKAHFVPNGSITQVSNCTSKWGSALLKLRVPYDVDVDQAIKIIEELIDELEQDAEWGPLMHVHDPDNDWPSPWIFGVTDFTKEGVEIGMLVKTERTSHWAFAREMRRRIKQRFEAAGIEIPFDARFRMTPPPPAVASRSSGQSLETKSQDDEPDARAAAAAKYSGQDSRDELDGEGNEE